MVRNKWRATDRGFLAQRASGIWPLHRAHVAWAASLLIPNNERGQLHWGKGDTMSMRAAVDRSCKMKHFGLALCLFSIGIANGCSRDSFNGDPLDEVASVSAANRPALQACLAAPDLPGNHWPAGAGKARCWLSLAQEPSLKEIAATLSEPDGAVKLDRRYAEILAAHYNDPMHRDALFAAYQDFGTAEGQRLADDWLAKSRGSAFAPHGQGPGSARSRLEGSRQPICCGHHRPSVCRHERAIEDRRTVAGISASR